MGILPDDTAATIVLGNMIGHLANEELLRLLTTLIAVANAAEVKYPQVEDNKAGMFCTFCWTNIMGSEELKEALKEWREVKAML